MKKYLESRNFSQKTPFVLQEALNADEEWACAGLVRDGKILSFTAFKSHYSCLVYEKADEKQYQEMYEFFKGLVKKINISGMACFLLLLYKRLARHDFVYFCIKKSRITAFLFPKRNKEKQSKKT